MKATEHGQIRVVPDVRDVLSDCYELANDIDAFPSLLAVMSFRTIDEALAELLFPSLLGVMSFRAPPSFFVRDLAPDIRNLGAYGPIRPDSRRGPE